MLGVVMKHSRHLRTICCSGHLAHQTRAHGTLLAGCATATYWLLLMLHELVQDLSAFGAAPGHAGTTNVIDDLSHA
eukprot:4698059-Amphidinium_carterae.1